MQINWGNFKKFIDDTELYHFVNYMYLTDNVFVWIAYQNENFSVILAVGDADYEDFEQNYKSKAILKNDITEDGVKFSRSTKVNLTRFFQSHFAVIETSTDYNSDHSNYTTVVRFDEDGKVTTIESETVKTTLDFEPDFNYELYGGGTESIDELVDDYYVSAVVAPDVPSEYGGNLHVLRNKLLLKPFENIFRSGLGTRELIYDATTHSNKLRLEIKHEKGIKTKFQIEIQYYK